VVALLLSAGAALVFASGGTETPAAGAQKELVIKWFGTRGIPGQNAPVPKMLEQLISKRVGYPVKFDLYGAVENPDQKLQLMLAANELPDVLFYGSLDQQFLEQAVAKIDLKEMLDYMPMMSKWLKQIMVDLGLNEQKTWAIYQDKAGKMYGTPRIWDIGWLPSGQMWRKDVLDKLGKPIPTTLAEVESAFAAYRAMYPKDYPWTAAGKVTWQCFDLVFNAYGIDNGSMHVVDGTVRQYFATPDYKKALELLASWYKKGYIDPEWLTYGNPDKTALWSKGKFMVMEWMSRNEWLASPSSFSEQLIRNVPGAQPVPGAHIRADKNTKPVQRVWDPFLTQTIAFGKHLDKDHDKIHKIMAVGDLISQDKEVKMLAAYGVEGQHYTMVPGEPLPVPTDAVRGLSVPDAIEKFGFGFYWDGNFSTYTILPATAQKAVDMYAKDPNGLYGKNNLTYWFPLLNVAVKDEKGENIDQMMAADTKLNGWVMSTKIITGAEPVSYYDEWLKYWYDNGGKRWEQNATRIYNTK